LVSLLDLKRLEAEHAVVMSTAASEPISLLFQAI